MLPNTQGFRVKDSIYSFLYHNTSKAESSYSLVIEIR